MSVDNFIKDVEKKMLGVIEHSKRDFATLHVGGARVDFLDTVQVNVYGSCAPIKYVATINVSDTFSLKVVPFDKNNCKVIAKAIQDANLGVGVIAEPDSIRVTMPKITEERRKEYVKILKKFAEEGKIVIRNVRHDANGAVDLKKKNDNLSEDEVRRLKKEIQDLTDRFINEIDKMTEKKESEILKI